MPTRLPNGFTPSKDPNASVEAQYKLAGGAVILVKFLRPEGMHDRDWVSYLYRERANTLNGGHRILATKDRVAEPEATILVPPPRPPVVLA